MQPFARVVLYSFILLGFLSELKADDKQEIINNIKQTKTLKFQFEQIINTDIETGTCVMEFSTAIKCNYNDKNQKQIIAKKNSIHIYQARYKKLISYPDKNKMFSQILNKDNLIKQIQNSTLVEANNALVVTINNPEREELEVYFNKLNFVLEGWSLNDIRNNKIFFKIQVLEFNNVIDPNEFKVPVIN